jgi:hypothetical protein
MGNFIDVLQSIEVNAWIKFYFCKKNIEAAHDSNSLLTLYAAEIEMMLYVFVPLA